MINKEKDGSDNIEFGIPKKVLENVNLGERLLKGANGMLDSDRPDILILGYLRYIGMIENDGQSKDLQFKAFKLFSKLLARGRMWSTEQIEEAIQEGVKISKLLNERYW